jgi:aminopeptidase
LSSIADPRVERLADVLVGYSTRVGRGDLVIIATSPPAAPLVRAIWKRVLAAGGHPHLRVDLEDEVESLLKHGTNEQLDWVNPARLDAATEADVEIAIEADSNTKRLSGVEPARQARYARAREGLRDRYFERTAAGKLRRLVTLYPTAAAAQDAEMSLPDYEEFVYHAGLLDREDPVAEWRAVGKGLRALSDWLGTKSEVRVVADRTDLTVGVGGRTWIPCDGTDNFPDGEVFTGPVETSLEGTVRFTYPATFSGRMVKDIELVFREGQVVESSASEGNDFLREMLAMDDGARRAGEFAFGMNDAVREFTGHTLFDEKIGGTMHLALGKSYPESGGLNQSALHWDLVCDLRAGSEVYADGEVVYRDGRFLD